MPVGAYYKGKGKKVLADMVSRYGPEKGKRVFYATAEKRDQGPEDKKKKGKARHDALKSRGRK